MQSTDKSSRHDPDLTKLIAFYEIAQRADLTNHPDVVALPAFQKAKKHHEARAKVLREEFDTPAAVDAYIRFHLEGELTSHGKTWEDVWSEYAPDSLKTFPLPPGTL